MKRLLLVVVALALFVAGYLFIRWDPAQPRFTHLKSPRTPTYTFLHYNFLGSRPFAGGKMWLSLAMGTNSSVTYLFNVDERKVLGEIQNGWPLLFNSNQTQVLCVRRDSSGTSIFDKVRLLAEKLINPRYLP